MKTMEPIATIQQTQAQATPPSRNGKPAPGAATNLYVRAVSPQTVPEGAGLDHPSLFFNHELGWLDFNWRVLYQAFDKRIPLLERVRFLAISASNLDEFFQKRVGGLKRQEAAKVNVLSADGRTPTQQLQLIRRAAQMMWQLTAEVWQKDLKPALRTEAGVIITDYGELTAKQRKRLKTFFDDHIYPILTPLAVDLGRPFPFISNLSLSLAIVLRYPGKETTHFARVKVPTTDGRWLTVENSNNQHLLVPIEQVIANNVSELFPGMEIISVHAFRITRNADIRRDEEEAEDLLEMISDELRERRFANVVRLELETNMPEEIRQFLLQELELGPDDVYAIDGPLDLRDCFQLAALDLPQFKYEVWEPTIPQLLLPIHELHPEPDIFSIIRKGDFLVHHPYDSYVASVQRLVLEAAHDPKVLAIKQTFYRTSLQSPTIKALIRAAEKGKQVAALVEVKARFDEANNIELGQILEDAGVHVTYGLMGLKIHAKVTLVVREEENGPRAYCHIGTGNYHMTTSRLYSDVGIFTCDPLIGRDLINLFHYLTGHAPDQHYEKLIVAPRDMRQKFYALIQKEIEFQQRFGNGRIIAKMNALDDIGMIQALYRASQAGVQIDLIVRGHTRLRPGLKGYSDNIRIISIIGRFLEHDRVFYFHNNTDPEIFIGSADWRRRNLNERVEAVVPISDATLKKQLASMLEMSLQDNRLAWDLLPEGDYIQRQPKSGETTRAYHDMLMSLRKTRR